MWLRAVVVAWILPLVSMMASGAESAPAPSVSVPNQDSLRQSVGPAVCRLTVENSWGIPTAVATGFLIGDGRFLITDLGAVARPGVASVRITFLNGPVGRATQFGFANSNLGLVALRVEDGPDTKTGLTLASELPSVDGTTPAAVVGWGFGEDLCASVGRLSRGPFIRKFATRNQVEVRGGLEAFLCLKGGGLRGASGSPMVDADGKVLGSRRSRGCSRAASARGDDRGAAGTQAPLGIAGAPVAGPPSAPAGRTGDLGGICADRSECQEPYGLPDMRRQGHAQG